MQASCLLCAHPYATITLGSRQAEEIGYSGMCFSNSEGDFYTEHHHYESSPRIVRCSNMAGSFSIIPKGHIFALFSSIPASLLISSSPNRDRLVWRDGMRIILSDVHGFMISFQLHKSRALTGPTPSPPALSLEALKLSDKNYRKRTRSQNSVRFSSEVEFQDEATRSVLERFPLLPDEDDDNNAHEEQQPDHLDFLYLTNNKGQTIELPPTTTSQIFLGFNPTEPFAPSAGAAAVLCITRIGNTVHLVSPRVCKPRIEVEIRLELPTNQDFALKDEDVVELNNTKFTFSIPRPARSAPKSKKDMVNPAQHLNALVIKTSWQHARRCRWNGAVESASTSLGRFHSSFTMAGEEIRIGRLCTVQEPDQTLANHHATISTFSSSLGFCSIWPVKETKPIHLLIGREDVQNRPAVPLRVGDCFSIGKSEFCVVFQQRGNRISFPASSTSNDELIARVMSYQGALRKTRQDKSPAIPTDSMNECIDYDEDNGDNLSQTSSFEDDEHQQNVPSFTTLDSLFEYFQIATTTTVEPMMVLMTVKGPRSKQFFLCNPVETTIGNATGNAITIAADRRMSESHCRIYFDQTAHRWMLDDLQSKHGTFLKIKRDLPHLLCAGDLISMGLTTMQVMNNE